MASPSKKLATSLAVLKEIQDRGTIAIKTDVLSRVHRERLLNNGFIREVCNGWYIIVPPTKTMGDSISWYSSFWGFCAQLMDEKYGDDWCLTPEQSLLLHAGNRAVPRN